MAWPEPCELTLPMSDGVALSYRAWLPAGATAAVVLCHRGHEHGGRLAEAAAAVTPPGVAAFAWDARGHGRSPGPVGDFARMVRDLEDFVQGLAARHGIAVADLVVVAHSIAGTVAAAWVHDFAPAVRGLVLVTPAFRVRLYIPGAIPLLRLLHRLRPAAVVTSYVRPGMLTADPDQAAAYAADPLVNRTVSNRLLLGMHDAATRLLDDAGAIRTPTLMLTAGRDWVVDLAAERRFHERLGAPVKHHLHYPGMRHALLHERDRHLPLAAIRDFVIARLAQPGEDRTALLAAGDPCTAAVHARLRAPLPWWSPARWGYAATGAAMATLGRLSAGIDLGWRRGFDSGASLDHVYRDRAAGRTPLGRLIDRVYLDSPGWRGIRQRRVHLVEAIAEGLATVGADGRPVHLVDVAAGSGRYVLEALARCPAVAATALLRDASAAAVADGRRLAEEGGLAARVRHEPGDAFDAAALAALDPRPDVAVVSGLYELFPDNAAVRRSLAGLARAVPSGGLLIYTCQPWHPQLAFIARTLTGQDGRPWIMRCRPQAEMDALVEDAGFVRIALRLGDGGLFTVATARRR